MNALSRAGRTVPPPGRRCRAIKEEGSGPRGAQPARRVNAGNAANAWTDAEKRSSSVLWLLRVGLSERGSPPTPRSRCRKRSRPSTARASEHEPATRRARRRLAAPSGQAPRSPCVPCSNDTRSPPLGSIREADHQIAPYLHATEPSAPHPAALLGARERRDERPYSRHRSQFYLGFLSQDAADVTVPSPGPGTRNRLARCESARSGLQHGAER